MTVPYRAFVLDLSYFSGKLEAYLRYKEIPYERIEPGWITLATEIRNQTGIVKVPLLQTPEGEWLQDTTPIIDWLEARHPEGAVLPEDPYQSFFCRLLEDYADEWLWRPALHYRWSHAQDRTLMGTRIARETLFELPGPVALKAAYLRARQRAVYVRGDGVTRETRAHVESIYLDTLDRLEEIFEKQSFLLGGRPCLADFGFFASMFRHFSLDPTPARIMRERAPAVYAWVARLWNARHSRIKADWPPAETLPSGWEALIRDVGEAYLPALHANALAWQRGSRNHELRVQGAHYRKLPTVQYRVWCREQLQAHFEALPESAKSAARDTLERCGAWESLWADGRIEA